MQCCGAPFKIGDTVDWKIIKEPQFSFDFGLLDDVDYAYEAHDHTAKLYNFTGVVTRIHGLYERYEPSKENPKFLTPVYGELIETTFADRKDKAIGDLELSGFVIELKNCSVSELGKEENYEKIVYRNKTGRL